MYNNQFNKKTFGANTSLKTIKCINKISIIYKYINMTYAI